MILFVHSEKKITCRQWGIPKNGENQCSFFATKLHTYWVCGKFFTKYSKEYKVPNLVSHYVGTNLENVLDDLLTDRIKRMAVLLRWR